MIFFYQNTRSIRGEDRLRDLNNNLQQFLNKPQIIFLTETWLSPSITDAELNLTDYIIYRNDRKGNVTERGGGVLIGIDKKLKSKVIEYSEPYHNSDHIFLQISTPNCKWIVSTSYFPPQSTIENYLGFCNHLNKIADKYVGYKFFITGDFNLSHITWSYNDGLTKSESNDCPSFNKEAANIIFPVLASLDLVQQHPNHPGKQYSLDLAFSSIGSTEYLHSDDYIVKFDLQHHLSATFSSNKGTILDSASYHHSRYNFNKMNAEEMNHCLSYVNWFDFIDFNIFSFDDCIHNFYQLLHELIDVTVPKFQVRTSSYPNWYSMELINLIQHKKKIHLQWKSTRDPDVYIEFKKYRALCKFNSRVCYRIYINKVEYSISQDIKFFWRFFNTLKKSSSLPNTFFLNDTTSDDSFEISNLFVNHFKSVYNNTTLQLNCNIPYNQSTLINEMTVTTDLLDLAGKTLKNSNQMGPDFIPESLIKICFQQLILPLLLFFSQSFKTGYIPPIWKLAFINPIFKAGDISNIQNYRPIQILCIIFKLLDYIFYLIIYEKLSSLISQHQHGFLKDKSVITSMYEFSNEAVEVITNGHQMDVVYIDYAKAFDKVNHALLIEKLSFMGVRGSALRWIESYLLNRFQAVKFKNSISNWFPVISGVPQGSHSGPFLFLLFINDLFSHIKYSKIELFADDTRIRKTIHNFLDSMLLQTDIIHFQNWSIENGLPVNISKSQVISFFKKSINYKFNYQLNSITLERVSKVRDLGIILDEKWSFNNHLDHIISKASRMIGFIRRSTPGFKSTKTLSILYKTLVLPHLLFGTVIWRPYTLSDQHRLETIAHKFLRFASYKIGQPMKYFDHNYKEISVKLNIFSVLSYHQVNDVVFVNIATNKNLFNDIDNAFNFTNRNIGYNLRNYRVLSEGQTINNRLFNSPHFRLTRTWNSDPFINKTSIETDFDTFKNIIKHRFLKYYD